MKSIGRFGTAYNFVSLTSDPNLDESGYRDFHDQFSDSTVATVLQAVKFRSHYIYCEEQPIFKNGGIYYNLVKSGHYEKCMDFVVEVMPPLSDDEWDYDMVLEEWVKSFLSLEVPEPEDFLPIDKSRDYVSFILLGLCKDIIEIGGEDYGSYIEEAIDLFCDHFQTV